MEKIKTQEKGSNPSKTPVRVLGDILGPFRGLVPIKSGDPSVWISAPFPAPPATDFPRGRGWILFEVRDRRRKASPMVRLPPLAAGYAYRLSGFLGLFPVFGHETNAILPYPWGMLHIKTVAWTTEEIVKPYCLNFFLI
jgi:hypothetical protein